ncbi:hypothetical protein V5799_008822 [Amblyomma americanum]|uniref:Uncharacterized protein n=1 Tax=Amblyomma americanum TaxID=6943 RepID=A0AAQ4FDR5_AMBAM
MLPALQLGEPGLGCGCTYLKKRTRGSRKNGNRCCCFWSGGQFAGARPWLSRHRCRYRCVRPHRLHRTTWVA